MLSYYSASDSSNTIVNCFPCSDSYLASSSYYCIYSSECSISASSSFWISLETYEINNSSFGMGASILWGDFSTVIFSLESDWYDFRDFWFLTRTSESSFSRERVLYRSMRKSISGTARSWSFFDFMMVSYWFTICLTEPVRPDLSCIFPANIKSSSALSGTRFLSGEASKITSSFGLVKIFSGSLAPLRRFFDTDERS